MRLWPPLALGCAEAGMKVVLQRVRADPRGGKLAQGQHKMILFPWQVLRSLTEALKMLKGGAGRIVSAQPNPKYFLPAPFGEPSESVF